jgi:hypothetical protein
LRVEFRKVVKVDELAHLIPYKAGATFSQLWQIFYYTRLFKYVKYHHYAQIKTSFNKICTYDKLKDLCNLGYFKSPQEGVYCATDKVLPILKEAGFIIETLPAEPVGKGDINELNNTEVFISLLKQQYFYTFLFPNFGYLIPDALMVLLDNENRKYKLTFVEVEAEKPDWKNYIENKENNYLKLAKDMQFYEKWKEYCKLLNLPEPSLDIKFNYKIIKTNGTI